MLRSRLPLIGILLPVHLLAAQAEPAPTHQWRLGLSTMLVIPTLDLVDEGRIGLGTDFALSHRVGRRTFVGVELRLGGLGPPMHVRKGDNVPIQFDQKDVAENSLSVLAIPVHHELGNGPIRPYLFGSIGYAIWGVKAWNERANESPSLFPTLRSGQVEFTPGVGIIALAHEARRDWYVDLGARFASSGTVPYLLRSGFVSEGGKTHLDRTPVHASVLLFHVGATAMLP